MMLLKGEALENGSQFGKYRLIEEIGEGPLAHAFLADDTFLGRQVVLKILKAEFARDVPEEPGADEAVNPSAALRHPAILPLYTSGSDHGLYYYSMAPMSGGNLRAAMARGVSPQQALTILAQICAALAFAHGKGVNHQGIKPENILFQKDGSAVLCDFRAVKLHAFGTGVLAREPAPHPHYISPEQIQSSGRQFGRSDLYSLGVVLFEMLTGHPPYRGDDPHDQHLHSAVPRLPAELGDYQELIDRLLVKDPAERLADAGELGRRVEQLLAPGRGKVTVLPLRGKAAAPGIGGNALSAPTRAATEKKIPATAAPPAAQPSGEARPVRPSAPPAADAKKRGRPARLAALVALLIAAGGYYAWMNGSSGLQHVVAPLPAILPPAESSSVQEAEAPAEAAPEESQEGVIDAMFAAALDAVQQGRSEEGAALYRELIERAALPQAYNNLAAMLAAAGDLDASQRMLQEALRSYPAFSTIYDNLNTIQLERSLGDYRTEVASGPRLLVITELGANRLDPVVVPPPLVSPMSADPLPEEASAHQAPWQSDHSEAAALLQEWAAAWSAQDFPRYLSFYGRDFEPTRGLSRPEWEALRHRNVTAPQWIAVSLDEPSVSPVGSDALRVLVVQEYRSDRFADRTLKAFELAREGDQWVILAEESLGNLQ